MKALKVGLNIETAQKQLILAKHLSKTEMGSGAYEAGEAHLSLGLGGIQETTGWGVVNLRKSHEKNEK